MIFRHAFWKRVLIFCWSIIFITSCHVGLGTAVDTQSPVVSISSPSDASVTRGTISIEGNYSDDIGVKSVSVQIYNITDMSQSRSVSSADSSGVQLSADSKTGTWSYEFDSKAIDEATGEYIYKDGTYKIVVVASDGTYTSTEATRTFEVDNTAPVFLLTSPTSTTISSGTNYGTSIKISGEVADNHSIDYMNLQVFAVSSDGTVNTSPIEFTQYTTSTSTIKTTTLTYNDIEIAGGTEVTVAKYDSSPTTITDLDKRNLAMVYAQMYEAAGVEEGTAAKFYLKVSMTDLAGNTSENVWIKSTLKSALKKAFNSASAVEIESSDIKKILNGTYDTTSGSFSEDDVEKIRTVLDVTKVSLGSTDVETLNVEDEIPLAISVNSNISPKYYVNGYALDTSEDNITWNSLSTNGVLAIQVVKGTGADSGVIPSSLTAFLTPCDESAIVETSKDVIEISGDYMVSDTDSSQASKTDTETDSTTYSISLENFDGLTAGQYYLVTMTGNDGDDNDIVGASTYGFYTPSTASAPTISKVGFTAGSVASDVQTSAQTSTSTFNTLEVWGGSNKRYLVFEVQASDSKGIDTVKVNWGNDSSADFTNVSGTNRYISDPIDLSSTATGNYTFKFTVTNIENVSTSTNRSANVDNDGPIVKVTSPAYGSSGKFTAEMEILGTVQDSYSSVDDFMYCIVDNDMAANATTVEAQIAQVKEYFNNRSIYNSGTYPTWDFTFTPFQIADVDKYTISDNDYYKVPVWFYATDELGNYTLVSSLTTGTSGNAVTTNAGGEYTFLYNPYADRPTTEITQPESATTQSGTITVAGSAEDNVSVSAVYVQFDWDGDGVFETLDEEGITSENSGLTIVSSADISDIDDTADPDFWGVLAEKTSSWKLQINKNGDFYKANEKGSNGMPVIKIRAAALDNNNLLGNWSDPVTITINENAPSISEVYAKQYTDIADSSTETGSSEFSNGDAFKGEWYLEAAVLTQIAEGIDISNSSKCYYKVAGSSSGLASASTNAITYYDEYSVTIGDVNYSGYKIRIPMATDSGAGTKYMQIRVQDAADTGSLDCTETFYYSYDNTVPVQQGTKINNELGQSALVDASGNPIAFTKQKISNHVLTFGGNISDTGLGVDKAIFYFRRPDASDSESYTIELPLPYENTDGSYSSESSAAVSYAISSSEVKLSAGASGNNNVSLDSTSGLYGVTLEGATRSSDTQFYHSAVKDYKFIRAGSLAYIAGGFHRIKSVENGTVTFDDAIDGSKYTSAFFAAAFVVDNTETESSSWSSGCFELSNDDGDGIKEYLSGNTKSENWLVSIFADELEDGPVYIDSVVLDLAGNISEKASTYIMLANNTPRVTKVYVASDLNGNGTYSSDEAETDSEGNYYFTATNGSNYESDFVTIKDTGVRAIDNVAIAFELLGTYDPQEDSGYHGYGMGNGSLKYRWTTGTSEVTKLDSTSLLVTNDLKEFTSDEIFTDDSISAANSLNQIVILSSDLEKLAAEDSENYISIALWDETNGVTQGDFGTISPSDKSLTYYSSFGSQYTVINIPLTVDLSDGISPEASISDFYWKKDAEGYNSLYYYNDTKMGHIELADVDSLSGVVKVEGTAYDDQRLGSLTFTITEGSSSKLSKTIEYVSSSASWTSTGSLTSDGYNISAESTFSQAEGHKVNWTMLLDTAAIGNCSGAIISVTAKQSKAPYSTSSTQNKTVNIVPYITKVERSEDSTISGGVMNRSTFGAYPVVEGESITVYGFNFGTAATVYVGPEDKTSSSIKTEYTDKQSVTSTQSSPLSAGSFTMTVPEKSGKLFVENTTVSLNNDNDNDDYGSADTSDSDLVATTAFRANYGYNREAVSSKSLSVEYTDDRYLSVWSLGNFFAGTDGGAELKHPVMAADASGNLYASWVAQSNSNVMFSYGIADSVTPIFRCYDQPSEYTGVSIDTKAASTVTNYGGAAVAFVPEQQGSGGSFSYHGMSSAMIVGGMGAIQVSRSDLSNSTVYGTDNARIVTVDGNPIMQLDGDNASSYYNLANYDMNRRLGSFENPASARYGSYLHNIWYDNVTESIKYSVVDVTEVDKYKQNSGAIVGWVVLDGGFNGQDRVHNFEASDDTTESINNKLISFKQIHSVVTHSDLESKTRSFGGAAVYDSDIFLRKSNITQQTGTDAKTSVTYSSNNSGITPAVGDTIELLQNTAGDYAISVRTITSISGNTLYWSEDEPVYHAINTVTIFTGNMNVLGVTGTDLGNFNEITTSADQSNSAGISSDIDVTTAGYPVVAYYDAENSELRVAAASSSKPTLASQWTRYLAGSGISCSGEVSMVVDGADGIHIMFKDGDGQLCYLYSASVGGLSSLTSADIEVIDTNGSLSYGNISVIETSASGASAKTYKPVVTYLNSANNASCIKYAARSADAGSEGAWDYQIIPSLGSGHYAVGENEISIEGYKSSWASSSSVIVNQSLTSGTTGYSTSASPATIDAAIAFKSKRFETAYLKAE